MPHARRDGDRTLTSAAAEWATPDANTSSYSNGFMGPNLRQQSAEWATPASRDVKGSNGPEHFESRDRPHLDQLPNQVAMWNSPTAHDGRRPGADHASTQGANLSRQAAQEWCTPGAMAGGSVSRSGDRIDEPLLAGQAESVTYGRPDPVGGESEIDGPTSSPTSPTSRPRLNPWFVEWLMGVPEGWTTCACSATAWCLWKRRMRSSLWRLLRATAEGAMAMEADESPLFAKGLT